MRSSRSLLALSISSAGTRPPSMVVNCQLCQAGSSACCPRCHRSKAQLPRPAGVLIKNACPWRSLKVGLSTSVQAVSLIKLNSSMTMPSRPTPRRLSKLSAPRRLMVLPLTNSMVRSLSFIFLTQRRLCNRSLSGFQMVCLLWRYVGLIYQTLRLGCDDQRHISLKAK